MQFSINPKYYLVSAIILALLSLVLFSSVAYSEFLNIKQASVAIDERLSAQKTSAGDLSPLAYNMQSIRSANLFAVKKKPKKKVIKAKKTQLRLRLDGIVASDKDGLSRAVIRSNNKKSLTYSLGDKIEGTNAKLHSVEADRVLIDRAGVLESLELERKKIEL